MIRLAVCLLLLAANMAHAQDVVPAAVRAHAVRRTASITIDGKLAEQAWLDAPKQTGFMQRFPKSGAKPDHDTTFSILYDDDAIYVGVWAHDNDPTRIRGLLTRRDVDAPSDVVLVGIDSYHDKRTAFVFQLNAAGVQRDFLVFDNTNADDTWDTVWTGDASINDQGWTAEFRIPLNQLRFTGAASHEWGLQLVRVVARTKEETAWSPWPRSAPQVVSNFGILDGITNVKPGRRLELLPYVLGGVGVVPVSPSDPLNDRVGAERNLGLDFKYGLGPAFTLSATINPDFGQVEADPSQVNLGANELFFAEKRPFFLEGVDLFKTPIGNGGNQVEGMFYSRRIGAAPAEPNVDYDYIDMPTSTAIYGAAKLTGKQAGWSVGFLDAITGQETALVDLGGMRSEPIVAPLTNYAVASVKRDLREGKTSLGVSASAVHRALGGTPLEMKLHDQAYVGALKVEHRWGDNAWVANARLLGSVVHGSTDAITRTQMLQRHLYQRPDASHIELDPTRRSLAGLGATYAIGRSGDTKHWRFDTGADVRSPGLELNDAGFMQFADGIIPYIWVQYREDEPSKHVLNWQWNSNVFLVSDFQPVLQMIGLENNISAQFANYWQASFGINTNNNRWDPGALRGGPKLRRDNGANGFVCITSDTRKRLWLNFCTNGHYQPNPDDSHVAVDFSATIQARSNIDISIGPNWFSANGAMQYVASPEDAMGQPHYVLARIRQTTASMTLRVNWTFSPKLSLQAYAQPFIAAGRYSEYKDVDNPYARNYRDRFHLIEGNEYMENDGTISVVLPSGAAYSFGKPDFDFRQLRSTVVMRWEYRPGSNVFAIWSHGQTAFEDDGRFRLGHDLSELVHAQSEDVVMVKANYWIGL